MTLSCCIWALSGSDEDILTQIADLGFTTIDIQPHMLTTGSAQAKRGSLKLDVSCIAGSFDMPANAALDSPDEAARTLALDHLKAAFAHGAALGATASYIVPGDDTSQSTLNRYAQSLAAAADLAAEQGLKLCVEHFPGRALPTAAGTLEFLQEIGHPNLYLLYDSGHIQMAGEDPAEIIARAGSRLGYVHLDDNDGTNDLHWSLLDGVMTRKSLQATFDALTKVGYQDAISLELSPSLSDPVDALQKSREIVLELL